MDKVNYWLGSLSPMVAAIFIIAWANLWDFSQEGEPETLGGLARGAIGLGLILYAFSLMFWGEKRLTPTDEGVSKG